MDSKIKMEQQIKKDVIKENECGNKLKSCEKTDTDGGACLMTHLKWICLWMKKVSTLTFFHSVAQFPVTEY
jgi:hypothetical protein